MRRLLVVGCVAAFIESSFFAALAPLLPSLRDELGLTTSGAGVLAGSYAAGILIMAVPSGWYAARFGPRRALVTGLTVMGAFSVVFGVAGSIWLLDVARFMQGVGGALMWVGAMSWIVNAGPAGRRGALVGMLVAAATVGELLGAPLGAMAHAVGMAPVFGAVAIVCAALIALALKTPDAAAERPQGPGCAWGLATRSHLFAAISLLAAASLAFGLVIVIAPLRLDALGASAMLIALAFAVGSLVETILGPQIGRLSDRIGRARPYRLGSVVGALAVVAIATMNAKELVFAALVLFALAAGLAFTPSLALAADAAEAAGVDQGYASGFTNIGWGGGQVLGAVVGGALAAFSFLLPALIGAALLLLAGAFAGRIAAAVDRGSGLVPGNEAAALG